jgi:hypothetical protein
MKQKELELCQNINSIIKDNHTLSMSLEDLNDKNKELYENIESVSNELGEKDYIIEK